MRSNLYKRENIVKILKSIAKVLKKQLPYDIIKSQKRNNELQIMEVIKMKELMWQEFDKNDRLVTKRKSFKSGEAMEKFIEKLTGKDNFYTILATRLG